MSYELPPGGGGEEKTMQKKRQRKIGEAAIAEVLRLQKTYPGMESRDICAAVVGKGLAEMISPSTVGAIVKAGSLEGYRQYLAAKREKWVSPEPPKGQVMIGMPEESPQEKAERPERSAAAAEMIANQKRILEEFAELNTHIIQAVNILYDIAGKIYGEREKPTE